MLEPNEIIVTMAAATRKSLQLTEPLVNVHDVFVQLNVTHLLKQSDHDDRFFLASRLGRYIMYEHSEGKKSSQKNGSKISTTRRFMFGRTAPSTSVSTKNSVCTARPTCSKKNNKTLNSIS